MGWILFFHNKNWIWIHLDSHCIFERGVCYVCVKGGGGENVIFHFTFQRFEITLDTEVDKWINMLKVSIKRDSSYKQSFCMQS